MICRKCGQEIPDGSVFCLKCGVNQKKNTGKKKIIMPILVIAIIMIAGMGITGILFGTRVLCIHDWKEADCRNPQVCIICGKTKGEALGHTYSELTCTEDSACIRCGVVKEKAAGHKWTEATCTEDAVCTVCGEVGEKATGHAWKEASCLAPKTCSVCGKTEGKKADHQWKDATCTEPKTCIFCGETNGEILGHDWIPATDTAPKTCSRCGETSGEKLEKATYTVSFRVYDLANQLGIQTAAHEILVVNSVHADNGTATVEGTSMWGTVAAETIKVTGCTEGSVTISGTIMTLAQDASQQGPFSFQATGYAG